MNRTDSILEARRLATDCYDWLLSGWASVFRNSINRRVREWVRTRKIDSIVVSPVNYCNAKCVFCGQHRFDRPRNSMSLGLFEQVVAQARAIGITKMDFTPPLGEPLLDPTLVFKAKAAKGLYRSITTNGILVTKNRWMIDNFDLIRISLGGMDRDSYRSAYRVDKFNDVYDGIKFLLDLNDMRKEPREIRLLFRSIKKPSEVMAHPNFKAIQGRRGLTWEFTNFYDNWGGSVRPTDLLGEMRFRSVKRKVGVPCRALSWVFVEPSGDVRLCGCRFKDREHDDLVAGNLNEKSLAEILGADSFMRVADRFISGNLPDVCKDCTLYRPFVKPQEA